VSSVNELFVAQIRVNPDLSMQTPAAPFSSYGNVANIDGYLEESVNYDARSGSYRARGINWDGNYSIGLKSGGVINPILTGTPAIDRTTKLVTSETIFGGTATIDPAMGTIKLSKATLPKNFVITLQYNPRFLRITPLGTSGYASPAALFDDRLGISNTATTYAFWRTPSGGLEPETSLNTFPHRIFVTATKSAVAGGQTSRPVMATYRLGIRLGRALRVLPDGSLNEPTFLITGNVGSYQLDPAAGKVYFTVADENRILNVSLDGVTSPKIVSLVGESAEEFVPMESAMNEANLFTFMDPMASNTLRRGMMWMLWTSNRNGSPNVYMQGLARKLSPILPAP
jgi:hypothetical protein